MKNAMTVVLLLLGSAGSLSVHGASFFGLGDLPDGATASYAHAVSGDGTTVVGQSASASGLEAIRWTVQGGIVGLGDLAGGIYESSALDVSYDGSVIVGFANIPSFIPTTPPQGGQTAFRWVNGTMTDIEPPSFTSTAFAVSADGSIVAGTRYQATNEPFFAFRAGVNIGRTGRGPVFESAKSLSADGLIAVGVGSFFSALNPEAVGWIPNADPKGYASGLGALPQSSSSVAEAISADGTTIVGHSSGPYGTEATIFTPGLPHGIGDLPGGSLSSRAYGVSGDGRIIVGEASADSGAEAFVWSEAGGMRSLKDLLMTSGVDVAGWSLYRAEDISDDGRVIVGVGVNPMGQPEGWVVMIPEPSSWFLVIWNVALLGVTTRISRPKNPLSRLA